METGEQAPGGVGAAQWAERILCPVSTSAESIFGLSILGLMSQQGGTKVVPSRLVSLWRMISAAHSMIGHAARYYRFFDFASRPL